MAKTRETRSCIRCGAAFEVTQATLRKSPRNGRFCSILCHNKSRIGIPAWNKGKQMSEAFREACRLAKRPAPKPASPEQRAKLRAALLGKKRDAAFRDAARRATVRRHEAGVYARKRDTAPEVALAAILDRTGVAYERQVGLMWWVADFLVRPMGLVLEADGDYWHANPAGYPVDRLNALQRAMVKRDRRRDAAMRARGWTVLRFWESDLLERPETCEAVVRATLAHHGFRP